MTMKNRTSVTTILFSTIILSMVVPILGFHYAEAQTVSAAKIPDDALIERTYDNWISQYKNNDEFEKTQTTVKEYVIANLPNNGWNQVMQKEQIRIQNFDTIIGKRGYDNEIVALFVAKQKALGTYDPSDAVSKYHEWVSQQVTVPKTVEDIDSRLTEIVDEKNIQLVSDFVTSYNNMAEHGNVPRELIESDLNYWVMTGHLAVCSYDPSCNSSELRSLYMQAQNQQQYYVIPVLAKIVNFFIPEALAYTPQQVVGYVYSYPIGCTGCAITDTKSGLSPQYPFQSSYDIHAGGTDLYGYGSSCSAVNGVSTSVLIDAYVSPSHYYKMGTGGTCAIASDTWTVSAHGGWPWTISGTANAWT